MVTLHENKRFLKPFLILYGWKYLGECQRVIKDIMKRLNIDILELYNTLKFMRNTMNVSSLNLNSETIVEMILDIYKYR